MPRRLAAAIALAAAAIAAAQNAPQPPPRVPEPEPRNVVDPARLLAAAPKAVIARDGLRVTIALPDPARGFYRSTRFDWSGMVTGATLRRARFYGLWVDGVAPNIHDFVDTPAGVIAGPRNAATGVAEEFASRDGETVPGYNDAPIGGAFVKIGVGRLRKEEAKPYDHFAAYPIVDGGAWAVRRSADRISFTHHLQPDASGYGYEYEKTITLGPGGTMVLAHRLRNTGIKQLRTQVYTHNFAIFDGAEIGPGVRVRFPFTPTGPVSAPDLAALDGDEVRYLRPLAPGDRVQLPVQPGGPDRPSGPFRVTGANGASMTMQADTPLVRSVLWSIRRTVAVEPFIQIDVAPGAEQRWSWRYTFAAGK